MDWTAHVDVYCERLSAAFWAEPLNALTNLAFIIAALVMAPRAARAADRPAQLLCAMLAIIGVGSFLFHTFATRWAGLADVLPILAFILVYVWFATRRFFHAPWWAAGLMVLAFVPVNLAVATLMREVGGLFAASAGYAGVVVFLLLYAGALAARHPATALRLTVGAAIFALSLTFRSADGPVCSAFPPGTHFMWHILNAVMLAWMIRTLMLARAPRVARGHGSV
ncbi:ceramidase domain-containing protein [Oceanicella sp. SM1341]|uniref:ceramidase domain-containing protein n=1 Tax=Oceanicella sp. SM1341 TaxID=1548889 RepID=UPI000E4E0A9A|nr:ceramidase domain-containing protein [Oceanicella sp. SM1341]